MGIQDDAVVTCAAYRVTENGQTWCFTTSPGEELMDAAQTLRRYCTSTEHSTGKFISLYSQAQPITPEEYQRMILLRMENTGKVAGVFDLDFDKWEFSAVHIMNGWTTWAMRDVIPSVYQATRPRFATAEEQLRKLLNLLDGMELTSAGHLTAQNFSFSDEILIENGMLNFYVQADFDVDAAFGTFVCTDENDDWLNIYANYDIVRDRPCDTLELNLCKGDGTEEYWSYHLNAAEQEMLARKMEAFCQQQNGMSLHDFERFCPLFGAPKAEQEKSIGAFLRQCRSRQPAVRTATRVCGILKMALIIEFQMCFGAILCKNARQPRVYKAFGTRRKEV